MIPMSDSTSLAVTMLRTLTPLATLGLGGQQYCPSGHRRASQSNVADAQQNTHQCEVLF